MAAERETVYSRSSLAQKLGVSLKQLTRTLIEAGWITQHDSGWKLTAKGEFEGGRYRRSQKYGEYIVWPAAILTHKVFDTYATPAVGATALGKPFQLSGHTVNAALAELGWITPHLKGWKLTAAGVALGAAQREDAKTGIPYVSWPRDTATNEPLRQVLAQLAGTDVPCCEAGGAEQVCALDGHRLGSVEEARVDNWLYVHNIVHAYRRPLATDTAVQSDFFLPVYQVVIELWPPRGDAQILAAKLEKRELYRRRQLKFIELQADDFGRLDEVLNRELFKLGVEV
ncbi:hypothetical protein FKG94_13515 [Exilibacterium tricleocarpae]|uniref:Glycerol kinase n=1 Tax=Exilibacterium tricleocarpae TaxID=2591008 RepID=A0A545TLK2_9GAMM|nr:hypothetical protein [Exilibacterium tricleocarpae]TQV78094.1 hypothetical protein FKG94_13515 [Exilibacterium tricleocarpae]